ncbi:Heterokaryon incompatibility protein 6, OR allele [Colletotrichum spinosum]|uniref:Heterokaryon incompatibility protein 6, OR allele n=1 Tax=Colletotrichum spinosum TaxID=1347390 RepID=A0A4R8QE96_9PEZI|nr:Heterokaryon incompatibility protein 6, OR allele [Colletotrichum spinosum]
MSRPRTPVERDEHAAQDGPGDEGWEGYDLQIALDQLAAGSTDALKIFLARQQGIDPDTVLLRQSAWQAREDSQLSYIGKMDDIGLPGATDKPLAGKTKRPRFELKDTRISLEYPPLDPERRQFRLIKLAPPDKDGIVRQLQLETFCLDDAPQYLCLSYVWGDPDRSMRVNCNGKMIPATQNLFHALQTCLGRYPEMWLWADGICINQDDVVERNAQVLLMGEIYERTAMVLAHPSHHKYRLVERTTASHDHGEVTQDRMGATLSSDDEKKPQPDTEISVGMVEIVDADGPEGDAYSSSSAQGAISIMTFLSRIWSDPDRDQIQSDTEWEKTGLPDPDTEYGHAIWQNLASFWTQDWYFRTWVLQEVVLPPKVVVLYGETAISLDAITEFWSLARQHGLPRVLRIGKYADMFSKVLHLSPVSSFESLRKRREKSKATSGNDAMNDQSGAMPQKEAIAAPSLLELLVMSRNNLATDPRDKVYGLLGLANDAVAQAIVPDYSPANTTAQVFTEVASEMVKAGEIVDFLQHAGLDQDIPGLPSWVTDWTRQSRSILPKHLYRCTGKTASTVSISEHDDGPRLLVRGAILGRVNQVGAAWKYYSHNESEDIFNRFETAPEQEMPPFNDEDARNFIMSLASNFEEFLADRYAAEGFEDALVRNLAVDCSWRGERIGRRGPGGLDNEKAMPDHEDETFAETSRSNEFFEAAAAFRRFYARGPESEEDLVAPGIRVHQTMIFMWLLDFDEETEAELQKQMVPYTVPFQEAQRGRRFAVLGTRVAAETETLRNGAEAGSDRQGGKKRYATKQAANYLMATLPWNAEIEDYVVLLEGFSTPFVLRRSKAGDGTEAEEFKVVGDCYVHGIMDGELLRRKDTISRDTELGREFFSKDLDGREYAIEAPQGFIPFTTFTLS